MQKYRVEIISMGIKYIKTQDVTMIRAILAEHAARASARYPKLGANLLDAAKAPRRAYKFPSAASARICLSRVESETVRRSRSLSFSRCFMRRI